MLGFILGQAASGGLELEATRTVSILFAFHRAPHSDTPLLNTPREHALTVAAEQTTSNLIEPEPKSLGPQSHRGSGVQYAKSLFLVSD